MRNPGMVSFLFALISDTQPSIQELSIQRRWINFSVILVRHFGWLVIAIPSLSKRSLGRWRRILAIVKHWLLLFMTYASRFELSRFLFLPFFQKRRMEFLIS